MILDKLVEKKNIVVFCNVRIQSLQNQRKRIIRETTEKKKRHSVSERFEGRIRELRYIRKLMNTDMLKKKSIQLWRELAKKDGP